MTANESFEAGDLSTAISRVAEDLRHDPANQGNRVFLFGLLCAVGELDRAGRQLDALAPQGKEAAAVVHSYRIVLEGEKKRRACFTQGSTPGLPKHVPPYTELHLAAVAKVRKGAFDDALALLEKAEELRPAVAGSIDGVAFQDLKDADDLIGPFLEVITPENYSWIPWEIVRGLVILPPKHLRDMFWIPARVELEFGSLGEVYLPVLYPGSYLSPDTQIKLGRATEWRTDAAGIALGSGQRILAADDRDCPLLEIRNLEIVPSEDPEIEPTSQN